MAVLVTKQAGNLTDNMYVSYSYNMWTNMNNIVPLLSTLRARTITFSSASNCRWIILWLRSANPSTVNKTDRWIYCSLEQNRWTCTLSIASPWVVIQTAHWLTEWQEIRFTTTWALPTGLVVNTLYYVRNPLANSFNVSSTPTWTLINFTWTQSWTHTLRWVANSKSLTADEINPELQYQQAKNLDYWNGWVPFEFDTPVVVTTVPNWWRFCVVNTTWTVATHYLMTSDNATWTAYSYVTRSDTEQMPVSWEDAIWFMHQTRINSNFTFKWYSADSDTVNAWCWWVTRSLNHDKLWRCNLIWEQNPTVKRTIQFDGYFQTSSFWGVAFCQPDWSAIPAKLCELRFPTATVWTWLRTAIYQPYRITSSTFRGRSTIIMKWAIPQRQYWVLAQDALVGQNQIVTAEDMSLYWWKAGDWVCPWKLDTKASMLTAVVWLQIQNISWKTITLSWNLATNTRKAGWTVINRDAGYWITITRPDALNYCYVSTGIASYFEIEGVNWYQLNINGSSTITSILNWYSLPQFTWQHYIKNNCFWIESTSYYLVFANLSVIPPKWMVYTDNVWVRVSLAYWLWAYVWPVFKSWVFKYKRNRILAFYSAWLNYTWWSTLQFEIEDNIYENSANLSCAIYFGWNWSIMKNNYFWGFATAASTYSTIQLLNWVNCTASWNVFDNCTWWYYVSAWTAINFKISDTFINNTTDIYFWPWWFYNTILFDKCVWINTIDETFYNDMSNGWYVAFTDRGWIVNNDIIYTFTWKRQRTWVWLPDTTRYWTDVFWWRAEPSLWNLEYCYDSPTGDISWVSNIVSVWCNINSANYWAGECVLPKLTLTYDNWTTLTATAAQVTWRQKLFVPLQTSTWSPLVKICINAQTDAVWSDAYVYRGHFDWSIPTIRNLDNRNGWFPILDIGQLKTNASYVKDAVWNADTTLYQNNKTFGKWLSIINEWVKKASKIIPHNTNI